MRTEIEVYRAIEELLTTQVTRETQKLLAPKNDMTSEQMHTLRGRVMAVDEALRLLRNNLGYDPKAL